MIQWLQSIDVFEAPGILITSKYCQLELDDGSLLAIYVANGFLQLDDFTKQRTSFVKLRVADHAGARCFHHHKKANFGLGWGVAGLEISAQVG
jgi:hypothetical protein